VENDAWKFNTSGKLLRNAVPLDDASCEEQKKDAWDAFVKEGASELEQEIAACLAPQLGQNLDRWDCNSHFMEELGVDSGGFGRLISQMRMRPSLRQVDLQMLFDHPTVRSLASALALSSMDSDSEDEEGSGLPDSDALLQGVMSHLEATPHAVCAEAGCHSVTYLQLFKLAASYQQLLHQNLKMQEAVRGRCVAICLDVPERMAAVLAVLREGCTFCLMDPRSSGSTIMEQLRLTKPGLLLATKADHATWMRLEGHCRLLASEAARLAIRTHVGFLSLQPFDLKAFVAAPCVGSFWSHPGRLYGAGRKCLDGTCRATTVPKRFRPLLHRFRREHLGSLIRLDA